MLTLVLFTVASSTVCYCGEVLTELIGFLRFKRGLLAVRVIAGTIQTGNCKSLFQEFKIMTVCNAFIYFSVFTLVIEEK